MLSLPIELTMPLSCLETCGQLRNGQKIRLMGEAHKPGCVTKKEILMFVEKHSEAIIMVLQGKSAKSKQTFENTLSSVWKCSLRERIDEEQRDEAGIKYEVPSPNSTLLADSVTLHHHEQWENSSNIQESQQHPTKKETDDSNSEDKVSDGEDNLEVKDDTSEGLNNDLSSQEDKTVQKSSHFRKHEHCVKPLSQSKLACKKRRKKNSKKETKLECKLCCRHYRTKNGLYCHNVKFHSNKPPKHQCPDCSMSFQLKKEYNSHLEFHKRFPDKRPRRPYNGNIAINRPKDLHCLFCKNKFSTACNRRDHERFRCIENPNREHVLKCHKCGFKTKEQTDLDEHKTEHEKNKFELVCHKCGKIYQTRGALYIHNLHVHADTPGRIQCSDCDKTFHLKGEFDTHRALVHVESPQHPCEVCGKLFKTKSGVHKHNRSVHENRYSYHCDKCGHGVQKKSYLDTHICGRVRRNQGIQLDVSSVQDLEYDVSSATCSKNPSSESDMTSQSEVPLHDRPAEQSHETQLPADNLNFEHHMSNIVESRFPSMATYDLPVPGHVSCTDDPEKTLTSHLITYDLGTHDASDNSAAIMENQDMTSYLDVGMSMLRNNNL